MFLWGLVSSPSCDCGFKPQSAGHLIYHCPIPILRLIRTLDETTIRWLQRLDVKSWNQLLIRKKNSVIAYLLFCQYFKD